MTLQELLEHAHLDALGHLDEREQAAFEAAFAVAPPAVKAQVRHEQARWAPMEHLLPQVEPSPELKDRVLEAVSAAMIAQGAGGDMSLRPSRRVAAAWRTASIGLLSAVVVLSAAFVYVFETEGEIKQIAQKNQATDPVAPNFRDDFRDALLNPATQVRYLATDDKAFTGRGSVWTNPAWARIFLELPKNVGGEEYRVVKITDGRSEDLAKVESNGVLQSAELPVLAAGTKIAVVAMAKGQVTKLDHVLLSVTI